MGSQKTAMHLQVGLLSAAQALFQTVSVLVMTIGALAGSILAPSPEWATAPIAAMFLGTAVGTVPASAWMSRVGRRTGFVAGALFGTVGGALAAAGMMFNSLLLLCLGTFLVGTYQSFAQFYRFAASEVADDAFRPRAISLVLAGGVVAALAGPALARLGGDLMAPTYTASSWLLSRCLAPSYFSGYAFRHPPRLKRAPQQPDPCSTSCASRPTSWRCSAPPRAMAS